MVLKHGKQTENCEILLAVFQECCLRRILRLRWEQRVAGAEFAQRTGMNNINDEVDLKVEIQIVWESVRMNKRRHVYNA